MGQDHSRDDPFLVADDTILCYTGQEKHVLVPSVIGGRAIRKIGSGAFSDHTIQSIEVEKGITEIHSNAFFRCNELQELTLPAGIESIQPRAVYSCAKLARIDMETAFQSVPNEAILTEKGFRRISFRLLLPKNRYRQLLQQARRTDGNCLLADGRSFPEGKDALAKLTGNRVKCAAFIPNDSNMLFHLADPNHGGFASLQDLHSKEALGRLFEPQPDWTYFRLDGRQKVMTEAEAAVHLASGGIGGPCGHEERLDAYVRADKDMFIEPTALIYFSEDETQNRKDERSIKLHVLCGLSFAPSVQPVRLGNRNYYVYRRHYLASSEDMPFCRVPMAVFDQSGRIPDLETMRDVYAKYKFLSLL